MATIDVLKKKLARLEAQAAELRREIDVLRGAAVQTMLPGLPAPAEPQRKRTAHEENYEEFRFLRQRRLQQLGAHVAPEDLNGPAFINAALFRIRSRCRDDAELFRLFDAYFSEVWPARMLPPYRFSSFVSDKVWPGLLEHVRLLAPEVQP